MPRSNSVIRRYTPPTCTLEILAQSSPLSRIMGKPVIKNLRFQLYFDDPRLPNENKIQVRGDRAQLEALCDAVTTYVQQLLQKSADSFWLSFADTPPLNSVLGESISPDPATTQTLHSDNSHIPNEKIYLEPSNQLTHKLYLGSLAHQISQPAIQLTLLQLFDLATALDEYSADVLALPNLENQPLEWKLPRWAPAAAVLVLAVGLTPITWQYANKLQQNQSQVAKQDEAEKLAINPAPASSLPTPQTALTPSDSLKVIPSLNPTEPLPTNKLPSAPLAFPNPTVPPAPKTASQIPLNNPITQPPLLPNPTLIIPTSKNIQTSRPNPPRIVQKRTAIPTSTTLPGNPNIASGNIATIPQSVVKVPSDFAIKPSNQQPISPAQLESQSLPGADVLIPQNSDSFSQSQAARSSSTSSPTENSPERTLFDTPQVAEAREFLKKKWQPPQGFSDTLEYSLLLEVDGKIARILPLNQAARIHIDITGIPQIGEPFVSPNQNGQNVRLRAVFNPDGKVQTFPESP
ncbi:MAG TPA: DUF4335 domain-containing protein [Nostocaceae cyanobacterium]|nr:DUF4335 domain-containing protein [Nostocaceae cyanobacterium]